MKMPVRCILVLSLFLAGCAHVISEESMRLVDTRITFEDLRKAPTLTSGSSSSSAGPLPG